MTAVEGEAESLEWKTENQSGAQQKYLEFILRAIKTIERS